jgi:hypothetical protein
MGEVYRARDTRLGREVALKVISDGSALDPERLQRFEQEARVAGSLNHPNLVVVYDVGSEGGAPFLVTELLEGESLRHRLSRGRMPLRTALELGVQIAEGLAAAHARGVVHRDVKPENVFLTSGGRAKLLDFGIAKLTAPRAIEGTRNLLDTTLTPEGLGTRPGAVLGTPGYMSPEQVRGDPVDARTDIFSLGAVVYEMLSGKRAFPGATFVESGNAILHEEPAPLPEQIPPLVSLLVHRCLAKEPAHRVQAASDLAFALELARTPTGSARPDTRRTPGRRWVLGMGVALLLIGALGTMAQLARGRPVRGPPQIERITFRDGAIWAARFTPEGRAVLSASWDGQPETVYSSAPGSTELQDLGFGDARLVGISKGGELALVMRPKFRSSWGAVGTLARAPLSGGLPRELAEDVLAADWTPGGQLVVVRQVGAGQRIERPLGTTVFETSGLIRQLRVSPNGDAVAFVDEGIDEPARIMLLDSRNQVRPLSRGYSFIGGFAWNPRSNELWFAAGDGAFTDTLVAAPIDGPSYEVYRSPGEIRIQDIAVDGRVLFTLEDEQYEFYVVKERGRAQRRLPGNSPWIGGLSPDGELAALTDLSPEGKKIVIVRKTDGSLPKILGEGYALDLSADSRFVLTYWKGGLLLLPVTTGNPIRVPTPGLEVIFPGRLFRDGTRVLVAAKPTEEREGRLFLLGPSGARKVSETSLSFWPAIVTLSPDERLVATLDRDDVLTIVPISGGTPIRLPEVSTDGLARPIGWSSDGDLWVLKGRDPPAHLLRVELRSHQIKESRDLGPDDPTGTSVVRWCRITPDGNTVGYSLLRNRSRLFVAKGLLPQ